jgi:2-oxoglutarate ferredoxin oxidoreductase subunit beta
MKPSFWKTASPCFSVLIRTKASAWMALSRRLLTLSDGYSASDLWIHDESDIFKAQILTRIFDDPKQAQHLPRPFGVFYQAIRPTYEDMMAMQLEEAKAKKANCRDLDKLLRGKALHTGLKNGTDTLGLVIDVCNKVPAE